MKIFNSFFCSILVILCLMASVCYANSFQLIALGVNGGITDGNLSAYLVAPVDDPHFAALDAGTLENGLEKSIAAHSLQYSIDSMLADHISVYLISHAHLDHVVGFLIAQPILQKKPILMAREETLEAFKSNLFNWVIWANFGDAGVKPQLNKQHFQQLPLLQFVPLPKTKLSVKALPLNHGKGYPSTAFLVRYQNNYLLYFGDTGADVIEHDNKMQQIWNEIAPLIRDHQLKSILLECSFTNAQPDKDLFGHLKPSLYLNELRALAKTVDPLHPKTALKGLTVFVTHIKPDVASLPADKNAKIILAELQSGNDLGVKFILPVQGKKYLM